MKNAHLLSRFTLPLLYCTLLFGAPATALAHAAERASGGDDHAHGTAANGEDTHRRDTHRPDDGHDHDHDEAEDDDHGHDHDDDVVELNARQRSLAGIRTATLTAQAVDYPLQAPAEIRSNDYTSHMVSPRVPSVVLRRHVTLGEHVSAGQPLVTLFSDEVARAQADYRVAHSEQQRVRQLGRSAVGERRFVEADAALAASRARLQAYGLDEDAISTLHRGDTPLGEYTLTARSDGAVLTDQFRQGQRAEAGIPLIELADESRLWVEAYLPAQSPAEMSAGLAADVVVGQISLTGTVIQQAHTIDPVTRTRIVRLDIDNSEHLLHPGQFAEVRFRFRTDEAVLTVPENALLRNPEGHWEIFVEDSPGHYRARTVTPGRALGLLREIEGIEAGTRVVTHGAFFVASQIAKGGFDPHNH